MGGVPSVGRGWAALRALWGPADPRPGLPSPQREGRPGSLSSVSRSLSPSFSWFEFFSPLHPLHAIFPSASAIRHEVMVMVIGGGQGGRGRARRQSGWGGGGGPGQCLVSMQSLGCVW